MTANTSMNIIRKEYSRIYLNIWICATLWKGGYKFVSMDFLATQFICHKTGDCQQLLRCTSCLCRYQEVWGSQGHSFRWPPWLSSSQSGPWVVRLPSALPPADASSPWGSTAPLELQVPPFPHFFSSSVTFSPFLCSPTLSPWASREREKSPASCQTPDSPGQGSCTSWHQLNNINWFSDNSRVTTNCFSEISRHWSSEFLKFSGKCISDTFKFLLNWIRIWIRSSSYSSSLWYVRLWSCLV